MSSKGKEKRREAVSGRRPFWLSAAKYYLLAATLAVATFLLLWAIFHDSGDELPMAPAAIGAGILLVIAVGLREIVLRRARNRFLAVQAALDRNLSRVYASAERRNVDKLTLERNAELLTEIKRKSDAAVVLERFAEGHREVYELCGEYIAIIDREFASIAPGSPRLPALRKGRKAVLEFHRFHLLRWASIETGSLIKEAGSHAVGPERVRSAQSALEIVDSALAFYPDERALTESKELLAEMLASIKLSDWVERAERATFDGDVRSARRLYRDALFFLSRDGMSSPERDAAAARINAAVSRLGDVASDI